MPVSVDPGGAWSLSGAWAGFMCEGAVLGEDGRGDEIVVDLFCVRVEEGRSWLFKGGKLLGSATGKL